MTDEPHPDDEPVEEMQHRLDQIERLLGPVLRPGEKAFRAVGGVAKPAWQQVTGIESRVSVTAAFVVAITLMALLPSRVANHPRWLVPGLASVLLLVVLIVNPMKLDARSRRLRPIAFALLTVISIGNAISAGRLIVDLVNATGIRTPETLLLTGAAIWTTNMIVFAIWYWEFDRGGPASRAMGSMQYPDFLFPQMTSPEYAPASWEPHFVDYLYLSFTNATAFSPTDVMPLARWTKLTMLGQSAVSLMTVALVIARAVNILK
jgi:uncharacterized membrane protein